MRREKRHNRITEQRKIQKEMRRISRIFLMLLSMVCIGSLTGCREKTSEKQTELISLDGRDTDAVEAEEDSAKETEKTDDSGAEESGSGQKNRLDDQGKLQICYVHVCGAVKSPGVYELTADSRLFEAIQMAGGLTDEAAGEALNQAELIEDGSRIYVPTKEEVKAGIDNGTFSQGADERQTGETAASDGGSVSDGKVNINTAVKEELMTLSGIGEAKADAIIRYREEHGRFQKIEDLMGVEGIKEGVFQKVKDQIKV